MLPQEHTLPGSQKKPLRFDWDGEGRCRQRSLHVGRHIIRPLLRVGVERIVLGDEASEPALEVTARRRVGIFLNQEAGGCMLNEERAKSVFNSRSSNDLGEPRREFEEARALGSEAKSLDQGLVDL